MTKAEAVALLNGIGDDEPVFVLWARDRWAAATVRDWAQRAQNAGGVEVERVEEAMVCAASMEAWRPARRRVVLPR